MAEFVIPTNCSADDLLCPDPLVCYDASELDWLEVDGCGCPFWYGWTGPDCEERNGPTYFLMASTIIQGSAALLLMLQGSITFFSYYREFGLKMNAQISTMLLGIVAALLVSIWRAIVLVTTLSPSGTRREGKSNDAEKTHVLVLAERSGIGLSIMFATLMALNVSLMWVSVSRASRSMTKRLSRGLELYRKGVLIFMGIFSVGLISLFGAGLTGIVAFFALPFMIIIATVYAWGAFSITKLLNAADSARHHTSGSDGRRSLYASMIADIRACALLLAVGLLLALVGAVIYSYLSIVAPGGQDNAVNPNNSIHPVVVANECIPLGVLVVIFSVVRYTRKNVHRNVASTKDTKAALAGSTTFSKPEDEDLTK
ncbi:Uncharacterized protein SCF082_LOCUS28362, partial [Durusdinium trenchii]